MSTTSTLNDVFKSAQSESAPRQYDRWLLQSSADGELSKIQPREMLCANLQGTEEPSYYMPLRDFLEKYVKDKPEGYAITDKSYQNATRWYLSVKEGVSLSLQSYYFILVKNNKSVNDPWAAICLLAFPIAPSGNDNCIYSISYSTEATASAASVNVRRIGMTTV